jgi:hypothetical protein
VAFRVVGCNSEGIYLVQDGVEQQLVRAVPFQHLPDRM